MHSKSFSFKKFFLHLKKKSLQHFQLLKKIAPKFSIIKSTRRTQMKQAQLKLIQSKKKWTDLIRLKKGKKLHLLHIFHLSEMNFSKLIFY